MTAVRRARSVGTLPVERAFVVQIEAEADLAAGLVGGRVEHVVSGRARRFRSVDQLLDFLDRATSTSPRAMTVRRGLRPDHGAMRTRRAQPCEGDEDEKS